MGQLESFNSDREQYFYGTHISLEEIERLKTFDFPTRFSLALLPRNMRGKTIIDVGAGANVSLGNEVKRGGGKYIAIDKSLEMLKQQKSDDPKRFALQSDILYLPFSRKLNIAHTRFVLMHLNKAQRIRAIQELCMVAHVNYILEYNWKTFSPPNDLLQEFVRINYEVASLAGIDLEIGAMLKELVEEVCGHNYHIEEKIFNEGLGNYYQEVSMLAQSVARQLERKLGDTAEARALLQIASKINAGLRLEECQPFTRPDVVAVTCYEKVL